MNTESILVRTMSDTVERPFDLFLISLIFTKE